MSLGLLKFSGGSVDDYAICRSSWEAAKKEANVEARFHDLRHTACTRLLERGASLAVVAAIMGWSASTTAKMAKRYGHIGSDAQRTALDALVRAPQPAVERGRTMLVNQTVDGNDH